MGQALYRKWRPLLWDEVVSQEHIVQTLKNAVANDRVAHAYLFSGPRGTGKTTAARLLAKAVNCLDPDTTRRPCNTCAHCVAANENRFMDMIEIDAASNTGVDDMRDLRDKINFSPSQGKYKIYIIDEVHMLSTSAFNALLKTLEEPPPHAIFILATTEIHKIPATVISRCQRHEFRRFPQGEIMRRLNDICKYEGIEIDSDALAMIARQSSGGLRDAISLLDQLSSTSKKITLDLILNVLGTATSQTVLGLVQAIIDKDAGAGLEIIHQALDGGADTRSLARQVVDYLRNLMLLQLGNGKEVEATEDVKTQMRGHASAFSTTEILRLVRIFNVAAVDQRGAWLPSLGLELALAESLEQPAVVESVAKPAARVAALYQTVPTRPVQSQDSEKPKAKPEADLHASVTLDQVIKVWKQVYEKVRVKDSNLSGLINSGKLVEVRDGVLVIAFASDILQEKFSRPANIEIVRKALQELINIDISIHTVVAGSKKDLPSSVKPGGMVAAASQLGGEIIDIH